MVVVLLFLGMMSVIALVNGFYKNGGFDVLLEFKLLSNPYYNIGVSFVAYTADEHMEEEFTIGLFFINIVIVFYKPHE